MNTIVANQKITKNTSNVWAVSIIGQEESTQYCKSAQSAMKLMFLLKSRTGCRISDKSIKALSEEIARLKSQASEVPAEPQEVKEAPKEVQPEPKEEPKAEKPAPKKRGRKPKSVAAAA